MDMPVCLLCRAQLQKYCARIDPAVVVQAIDVSAILSDNICCTVEGSGFVRHAGDERIPVQL